MFARACVRWCAVAFLASAWASVGAATAVKTSQTINLVNLGGGSVAAQGGGTISTAARSWSGIITDPTATSGIRTTGGVIDSWERVSGPGPRSAATVVASRVLTGPNMARAIARGLPLLGTAITIGEILESLRCREGFGGGAECDIGQPQESLSQYRCYANGSWNTYAYPSAAAACSAYFTQYTPASGSGSNIACSGGGFYVTNFVRVFTAFPSGKFGYVQTNTPTPNPTCASLPSPSVVTVDIWEGQANAPSMRCPAITVGGVLVTPALGIDLKCPTSSYTPTAETPLTDRIVQYGGTLGAGVAGELLGRGASIDHSAPGITVESPVQSQRRTVTNPDGSITTIDTDWPWTSSPEGYGWRERITSRTWPPGSSILPLGDDPGVSAPPPTVDEGPDPAPGGGGSGGGTGDKIITCGLPDTPACKIDESGMPADVAPDAFDSPTSPTAGLLAIITDPEIADTSFSWSFALPASCSPLTVGTFAGEAVVIDLCEYQPMIHDIMSVIWMMTGIFGAWQILARTMGST